MALKDVHALCRQALLLEDSTDDERPQLLNKYVQEVEETTQGEEVTKTDNTSVSLLPGMYSSLT